MAMSTTESHLRYLLLEPKIKPVNHSLETLFLGVLLPGIVQVAPQGKSMSHALEQLYLEFLLFLLHDVDGSIAEFVRERLVDLRARKKQRRSEIGEMGFLQESGMCESAR